MLYGEAGWDRLFGEQDNDALFGGSENDRLYGGAATRAGSETDTDNNFLTGEAGSDLLYGATGNDAMFGEVAVIRQVLPGQSTTGSFAAYGAQWRLSSPFALHVLAHALPNGWTADQTALFTSGNFLGFGMQNYGTVRTGASDLVFSSWAEQGNFADQDVIDGDDGSDLLVGSAAQDRIDGGFKADQLFGGAGDDNLAPGASIGQEDRISTGTGMDTVIVEYVVENPVTHAFQVWSNEYLVILDFASGFDRKETKFVSVFRNEGAG